ncbi:MAG: hypothetical protein DMF61_19645 [Blastocatellia bacterium AA13]|nr:MAG: hypothetical protein DMF61_19645 [Blastocatellia bacterium AA13]
MREVEDLHGAGLVGGAADHEGIADEHTAADRPSWETTADRRGLVSERRAGDRVGKQGRDYVRVEAARIDALLNLAGEMVIARSTLTQVAGELEQSIPKSELTDRFMIASSQMGKFIGELQKSVLKMRMVTIDQVFRRFGMPMRELAAERGKQVELEMRGGETELDRTLVDLIYEPLLHLLRNAVDHGLETPDERAAAGKPRVGKITMRAYHEGNQVVVEVSDDGRGVDIEALKAKAVDAGEISLEAAREMSDEDALDLMFVQGVSTAKEISMVSGRGIGAAAVKSVVEELRGTISVRSEFGSGATFVLRMPLTLAIIKALLFYAGGQLLALPLLVVGEVCRALTTDIVTFDGHESFRMRDRFISVVRPGRVLDYRERPSQHLGGIKLGAGEFFVIVANVTGKKFGIIAETLLGEQELVIKPLDSQWVENETLAGASVLGDGSVVLILDAGVLFRKAVKYEQGPSREAAAV